MNIKTYKDYLIDFDSLKVGDKLWSLSLGECKVIKKTNCEEYPIVVANEEGTFDEYTKEGKFAYYDIYASLFKEKPDFFKEKKEVKRWIWFYEYIDAAYGNVPQWCLSCELTEEEFLKSHKNASKHEKIDCTEMVEVVYE